MFAQTKMGMFMVDARGKVGGHVITKNRQGQAVRTKVTPVNRRSNSQQNNRSRFTSLSQNWRALTQVQRDAWNSAAGDAKRSNIFGDSYSPTGKNFYMIVNENLLLTGGSVISVPPDINSPVAPLTFLAPTNTTAAQSLSFTATPSGADTTLVIEATRPLSPGVSSPGSAFRVITYFTGSQASPLDTFNAYVNVFGSPVAGKKIFWRIIPISEISGTRGTPLQVSDITS